MITIPLLPIADAAAEYIKHQRYRRVGLLGTKFTMEQDFTSVPLLDTLRIHVERAVTWALD